VKTINFNREYFNPGGLRAVYFLNSFLASLFNHFNIKIKFLLRGGLIMIPSVNRERIYHLSAEIRIEI